MTVRRSVASLSDARFKRQAVVRRSNNYRIVTEGPGVGRAAEAGRPNGPPRTQPTEQVVAPRPSPPGSKAFSPTVAGRVRLRPGETVGRRQVVHVRFPGKFRDWSGLVTRSPVLASLRAGGDVVRASMTEPRESPSGPRSGAEGPATAFLGGARDSVEKRPGGGRSDG